MTTSIPSDNNVFCGSGVYVYHFSTPYKHAGHYTGFSENLAQRFAEHEKGKGARLTQVVVEAGRELILARVWHGMDRTFERRLKRQGHARIYCPICNGEKAYNNMRGDE